MATLIHTGGRQTPPGPKGHPLFGNAPAMVRNPLELFLAARRDYGDVARLRMVGPGAIYLISHPDAVEYILKSKQYGKGEVARAGKLLAGEGLATSDGETWRRKRRLAAPAFHRQRITGFAEMMTAAAVATAERWQPVARDGRPFDMVAEMRDLTLQIIGQALFSTDFSADADAIVAAFNVGVDYVAYRTFNPLALREQIPTPRNRRFLAARSALDTIVYRIIHERRRTGADHGDLLSMLLQTYDAEAGVGLGDQQIRDEVLTLIIAGHDSSTNTLAWAWYLLAQHPTSADKLRAELDAVLGPPEAGHAPTLDDLARLTYTRMVIDETLRLYPAGWAIGRRAATDDTISGYHIPAKAQVFVSPYVTHRHPDFWDNPDCFTPERFDPAHAASRHPFAYVPFGGGPHICIGSSVAMMEAQLLLATLAHRYRVDLVPGHPVEPELRSTLGLRHGLQVTLRERCSTADARHTGIDRG